MNEIEEILRKECFNVRIDFLVEADTGEWVRFTDWTPEDAEDFISDQNSSCTREDLEGLLDSVWFGGTGEN